MLCDHIVLLPLLHFAGSFIHHWEEKVLVQKSFPPLTSDELLLQRLGFPRKHAVHLRGTLGAQISQEDLAAPPRQLQNVLCQQLHRRVPHVVEVKHVLQILHDLVLQEKEGLQPDLLHLLVPATKGTHQQL